MAQQRQALVAELFIKQLGELFSREEKKTIPYFKETTDDLSVIDWLKEAERVARNNQWDNKQRIRFFSDRLNDEAADWHTEFVENLTAATDYDNWKKSLVQRFQDKSDIEKLKRKFLGLTQKLEQKTKTFINIINSLYDTIYGKEKEPSDNASDEAIEAINGLKIIRGDAKKKILLKGLLPKIKAELWPRLERDSTYDRTCDLALTAESIVIDKELSDCKNITAVIANINHHKEEQNRALAQQSNEIKQLRKELKTFFNATHKQTLREDCQNPGQSNTKEDIQSAQGYSRENDSRSRFPSP